VSTETTALPGQDTLLACWDALARLSPSAKLIYSGDAIAAVFPFWAPLNNAIMLNGDDAAALAAATSRLRSWFTAARVDAWALWLPSSTNDLDASDRVSEVDGFKRDTTTLVMQARLAARLPLDDRVVRTSIMAATRAADDSPIAAAELDAPDGVPGLMGWAILHDNFAVAGAWSFLLGSDCGIYTVGTVPAWRHRGFARALMTHVLADAQRNGADTATLQSTRMGQPLYESLGFKPVGRYEEWVPE
jgi:GNAT superfamily N-acetyltransferase